MQGRGGKKGLGRKHGSSQRGAALAPDHGSAPLQELVPLGVNPGRSPNDVKHLEQWIEEAEELLLEGQYVALCQKPGTSARRSAIISRVESAEDVRWLVYEARAGDEVPAQRWLGMLIAEEEPIPLPLRQYAFEFLFTRRQKRRGQNWWRNAIRDATIAVAVELIRQRSGLRATRNRVTAHTASACSIVAEAARRISMTMDTPSLSETAVEKIWNEYNHDPHWRAA